MQRVALDDLILTDEESAVARRQIRELAYFRWESAGCPQNRDLEFWTEAELEWVGLFTFQTGFGIKTLRPLASATFYTWYGRYFASAPAHATRC